uniref:Uncharacterized protein n=1 Tax=Lepeophtheirus salmonis TaxID=72036 RepID=A0A0K2UH58_LEPSM
MSYRAPSELYIMARRPIFTAKYNIENILSNPPLPTIQRGRENRSTLKRKLLPDMSKAIFQRERTNAHYT